MQSHLQAKGLNIWRVTSKDMKNNDQQEKQFDAISKCIILSSLEDNMLQMKDIMFSLINLIVSSNLIMKMLKLCTHG